MKAITQAQVPTHGAVRTRGGDKCPRGPAEKLPWAASNPGAASVLDPTVRTPSAARKAALLTTPRVQVQEAPRFPHPCPWNLGAASPSK